MGPSKGVDKEGSTLLSPWCPAPLATGLPHLQQVSTELSQSFVSKALSQILRPLPNLSVDTHSTQGNSHAALAPQLLQRSLCVQPLNMLGMVGSYCPPWKGEAVSFRECLHYSKPSWL